LKLTVKFALSGIFPAKNQRNVCLSLYIRKTQTQICQKLENHTFNYNTKLAIHRHTCSDYLANFCLLGSVATDWEYCCRMPTDICKCTNKLVGIIVTCRCIAMWQHFRHTDVTITISETNNWLQVWHHSLALQK
jgi:hypothetical protein